MGNTTGKFKPQKIASTPASSSVSISSNAQQVLSVLPTPIPPDSTHIYASTSNQTSTHQTDEETEVETENTRIGSNYPNTMYFINGSTTPLDNYDSSNHPADQLAGFDTSLLKPASSQNKHEYARLWWEHQDQFSYFYNCHFINDSKTDPRTSQPSTSSSSSKKPAKPKPPLYGTQSGSSSSEE
ncbi:hypothetical protein BB560_004821 [Smittium megazygosporum]|uniref:Uncharacterized protein n=1 Tax=Smittium megazygosporum TaxID=133381 RepID=A0A2T9Z866_9FUNG|nr:hypothetical protein BB560_004821 [Smittium megazygosporum]